MHKKRFSLTLFSPDASCHVLAGIVCPVCKNVGVAWSAQEGATPEVFCALSEQYLYRSLYGLRLHMYGSTWHCRGCSSWSGLTPGRPQLVLVDHTYNSAQTKQIINAHIYIYMVKICCNISYISSNSALLRLCIYGLCIKKTIYIFQRYF